MIGWWIVAAHAAWIAGLAIVLSAIAYHDWLARETGQRHQAVFAARSFQRPWRSGLVLTCIGFALSRTGHGWETVVWMALAVGFIVGPIAARVRRSAGPRRA